jgi:hypothetical protein
MFDTIAELRHFVLHVGSPVAGLLPLAGSVSSPLLLQLHPRQGDLDFGSDLIAAFQRNSQRVNLFEQRLERSVLSRFLS